jgi:hypothetical protein
MSGEGFMSEALPLRRRRVSLSKKRRDSPAAIELLSLCQTISEDGSLDDDELFSLKEWLSRYADTDLPAHGFLLETVWKVVSDKRVTTEEKTEIYEALEKVLPPDLRSSVRGRRVEAAKKQKAWLRARKEEERERNRPLLSLDFMVAGSLYEGRPLVVRNHAAEGDRVYLVRDSANGHSRHAIEIRLANGMQIGWMPEESACDASPLLDDGNLYTASLKKIIAGRRAPIPVVVASIHLRTATIPDLTSAEQTPPEVSIPPEYVSQASGADASGTRRREVTIEITSEKIRQHIEARRRKSAPALPRGRAGCLSTLIALLLLIAAIV